MRPYIICHMIASIDGRIDCAMVDKISGNEYETALEKLDCPSSLEGRVTMEHYNATNEPFVAQDNRPTGAPSFYVAELSDAYTVAVDTRGRLGWPSNRINGQPLVCIVSEQAPEEYLKTLKQQKISWIAIGQEKIDLAKAMEILYSEFGVKRLAVLGGGHINGGFLEAGLIDEVSLLVAAGIDGRKGQTALFDGIADPNRPPVPLKLKSVEQIDNSIWLRYTIDHP